METIGAELQLLFSQNPLLGYFFLYVGTIALGNIAAFAGLWLAFAGHLGHWGVLWATLTIFMADISGDVLWYTLGRFISTTRLATFLKSRLPVIQKVQDKLQANGSKVIFMSKFACGLSMPILFSVGWSHYDFHKFVRVAATAITIWIPVLLVLTYGLFSGIHLAQGESAYQQIEVLFAVGLGTFLLINYGLGWAVKKLFGNGHAPPAA